MKRLELQKTHTIVVCTPKNPYFHHAADSKKYAFLCKNDHFPLMESMKNRKKHRLHFFHTIKIRWMDESIRIFHISVERCRLDKKESNDEKNV